MRISYKFSILAAGLSVMLGGCGANHHSIYRSSAVSGNKASITLIDAKQRAILTAQRPVSKKDVDGNSAIESYRAFCTEPSPDVFSVLSQAMSFAGSAEKDKERAKIALEAAFSSSESGSTIARTQTINMLREMMYRTCERYLSGALGPTEFPIQAARDQRLMVSILAIEQLTGAVIPKTVTITSSSSANAGQNSSAAILVIKGAQDKSNQAAENLKKAEKDLATLEGDAKECTALKAQADAGAKFDAPADKAKKDKHDECNKARQKIGDAKEAKTKAEKEHAELLSPTANGGGPPSANSTGDAKEFEGVSNRPDQQSISSVATVVKEIVLAAFNQDEFGFTCMRELANASPSDPLIQACKTHQAELLRKNTVVVARQNDQMAFESAKIKVKTTQLLANSGAYFQDYWSKVDPDEDEVGDQSSIDEVINDDLLKEDVSQGSVTELRALRRQTKKSDSWDEFRSLPDTLQKRLAE